MTRRLAVQFLDQAFHRALFDAMPMPVFVVDDDVTILEYNSAAGRLLANEPQPVSGRRGGEVLHCLHAAESPQGCGRSQACLDCVVRDSVRQATRGARVTRRSTHMNLLSGGKPVRKKVRVSCQPFAFQGHSFNLLMLEGLND